MNYREQIRKLQMAINQSDEAFKVLCNTQQFYSVEKHRPINIYNIRMCSATDKRREYVDIFRTSTQLFVVFFLRNLYWLINGVEITETDFPVFEAQWHAFTETFSDKLAEIQGMEELKEV